MSDDDTKEDIAEIKASVFRIEHSLNGNGQPGLKTRVALLEQTSANASRLFWIIVGATVTTVTSTALALFAAFSTWGNQ